MYLAAAAFGIRATRRSLLRAGWSCWRKWAVATPRQAYRTTARPSGSGPTRQSDARDSLTERTCAVADRRHWRYVFADLAGVRSYQVSRFRFRTSVCMEHGSTTSLPFIPVAV